jgi:uncharacterized membrane protein
MSRRKTEPQEIEVHLAPSEYTFKARGLLAIKLGFIGSMSVLYLAYDLWWLKIDLIPALLIYLLCVVVFMSVLAYCWNKTISPLRKEKSRTVRIFH